MTPKVFFGSKKFSSSGPVIMAMGVFDGVHRGHQFIFKKLVERARQTNSIPVAYTFDPHPVRVLAPHACPSRFMINTIQQRIALIAEQGVKQIIVEHFTHAFAQQTPEEFFKKIIVKKIKAREIFVGYNFTFGVHRSGTVQHLETFGQATGIRVTIAKPFLSQETLTSSTQVRQMLTHGDLPAAKELLGHSYFMEGKVVQGRGVGGTLGIHTANMKSENELLLPWGVYATQTILGGKKHGSVTNIGPNPTFGKLPVSIETHIFDYSGDKRKSPQKIRVEFLKKIRDEIKFSSPQKLISQIHHDIQTAKKILKG